MKGVAGLSQDIGVALFWGAKVGGDSGCDCANIEVGTDSRRSIWGESELAGRVRWPKDGHGPSEHENEIGPLP